MKRILISIAEVVVVVSWLLGSGYIIYVTR